MLLALSILGGNSHETVPTLDYRLPGHISVYPSSVEESGASDTEDTAWSIEDEWLVGQTAPLNLLVIRSGTQGLHLALGELVPALLHSGRFTVSKSF